MAEGRILRAGIFGAGEIVRKAYLPLLPSWPGIELVGIYNRTEARAREAAQQWGIRFHTSSIELLIKLGLDIAFVLTNKESHYEICNTLLENQIDVFVEKPAATNSHETLALAELSQHHGRIFMVGFNRRYAPLYRQAKEVFTGRKIQFCLLEKHRPGLYDQDLAEAIQEDYIHQIDLLRFYTGEPMALETRAVLEAGKLRAAISTASLPSNGLGVVLTSREAGMWQERATITGDNLTVIVNAFRELRVLYPDHEEVYGTDRAGRWFPQLQERGFTGEIAHFLECVKTRSRPETDGFDALRTQNLLEEMLARVVSR